MNFAFFCPSLVSDWNNGNAHFLRGVCSELLERGHDVRVFEPENAWSVVNLVRDYGRAPIGQFHKQYPTLQSRCYSLQLLDLEALLDCVDVVIVHEWNDPVLVKRLGQFRRTHPRLRLLFHDTHHRSISNPREIPSEALGYYDGVLAFGARIQQEYLRRGWIGQAWVWHEAADTRVFFPRPQVPRRGDLVWVGNWGDDERTAAIHEFLIEPVHQLGLRTRVYGVRYPEDALQCLRSADIEYGGWLPNFKVPEEFASFAATVHIPRKQYIEVLHGIPTIRPFEAMACGIPLICALWSDTEGLFTAGADYLAVNNGEQMRRALCAVLADHALADALSSHARETILNNHTCAHRVDELLSIAEQIGATRINSTATRTPAGAVR